MRRAAIVIPAAMLVLAAGASTATAGSERVTADDFDFDPPKAKVDEGDKVKWLNVEGSHTVTGKSGTRKFENFDEVLDDPDEKTSFKFKQEGTYKYVCRFHRAEGMKGKVVVRD